MTSRILFLCARASSRSLLAASLLSAQAGSRWEAWSIPPRMHQVSNWLGKYRYGDPLKLSRSAITVFSWIGENCQMN